MVCVTWQYGPYKAAPASGNVPSLDEITGVTPEEPEPPMIMHNWNVWAANPEDARHKVKEPGVDENITRLTHQSDRDAVVILKVEQHDENAIDP